MIDETLNGRYRFVRQMGGGGMGAVYEAEELPGGRRVAVKVISTGDDSRDRALIGRFQREAKATMSIDTDHIVRVLDTGTDAESGHPFMVMEYLAGEDLSHTFKRLGPLTPDTALRIAAQTCIGLDKAHAARVVHRDIKPANLFLAETEDGGLILKVLDFGIAKIKMDQANITDSKSLTRTGSMVGSPLYMSPEQARGSKSIDHRADIWSLGIVLYQALAGRTPNQDIEALGELIIAICSELPRPVQELAPWVPLEVAAIVHRALRFEPGDRFQSAADMLDAIVRILPNGSALTAELLIPLDPSMRQYEAPRFFEESTLAPRRVSVRPPAPSAAHLTPNASSSALPSTPPAPDNTPLPPPARLPRIPVRLGGLGSVPAPAPATTDEGVATSRADSNVATIGAPLGGRNAALALVAILVAASAGFGAYKAMGRSLAPKDGGTALTVAPPPVLSVMPSAAVVVVAPPSAPPALSAPTVKSARVAILPLDAIVEIDGQKATLVDGAIAIAGALGTVHRVHVSRGDDQLTQDVAVTEQGAIPSKITLKTTPAKKPPR